MEMESKLSRECDSESKQQALKKVFDGQSVASVSRELGVTESLVYKWKRDALDHGANGLTGAEVKKIVRLKKRLRELEMENEILNGSLRASSDAEVKTLSIC